MSLKPIAMALTNLHLQNIVTSKTFQCCWWDSRNWVDTYMVLVQLLRGHHFLELHHFGV